MEEYQVIYSRDAAGDLREMRRWRADKLSKARANAWYKKRKKEIKEDLSFMPGKYRTREIKGYPEIKARIAIYDKQRLVAAYTVHEETRQVEILRVFSAGNNLVEG